MGMDLDYVIAEKKINELKKLVSDIPHGEREEIANDIIVFVDKLKTKYGN